MRIWKALVAVAAAVVLTVWVAIWMVGQRQHSPPFSAQNASQLRDDMSRARVEEILSVPPGDYRTRPTQGDINPAFVVSLRSTVAPDKMAVEQWTSDSVNVVVVFTPDQYVLFYNHHDLRPSDRSSLYTLYWQVRRLWTRWFTEN
jgi:hypothetical protein